MDTLIGLEISAHLHEMATVYANHTRGTQYYIAADRLDSAYDVLPAMKIIAHEIESMVAGNMVDDDHEIRSVLESWLVELTEELQKSAENKIYRNTPLLIHDHKKTPE